MSYKKGHASVQWCSEIFMNLPWCREPFNDSVQRSKWITAGYRPVESSGAWVDISNDAFPDIVKTQFGSWMGLNDIGLTIYKMETDEILPVHFDTYKYYKNLFNLDSSVDIVRTRIRITAPGSTVPIIVDRTAAQAFSILTSGYSIINTSLGFG
jgi:hypothetical protein